MRFRYLAAIVVALGSAAFALDGQIGIHDPSTIIQCDGKYYTFGTGGGGLISNDGWTWNRGASRPGGGVAQMLSTLVIATTFITLLPKGNPRPKST